MCTKLERKEQAELVEFTQLLLKKYGKDIELIELFGSAARGELSKYSDIDLLIVVRKNRLKLMKGAIPIATDMLLKYGRDISVKVYNINQYEYLLFLDTPFMRNIQREGRILWKRS